MYSYERFYEKDNEPHEVYFPVRLWWFKEGKTSTVKIKIFSIFCTVSGSFQQRGKTTTANECPEYKQSDGGVPVMLELRGMRSTSSLPSLSSSLWPGVVAHDRILSMGQIKQNCIDMQN